MGDRRRQNPGGAARALLDHKQREELSEALKEPPPDGGMWNSRKVAEWIEQNTGRERRAPSGRSVAGSTSRSWTTGPLRRRAPATARPIPKSKRLSKKSPPQGREPPREVPGSGGGAALWAQDEHRLDLKPLSRRVWALKGERDPR